MRYEDIVEGDVVKIVFKGDIGEWCIAYAIKDSSKIIFSDLYSNPEENIDFQYNLTLDKVESIEFLFHHKTMEQEFKERFPEYSI